MKKITLIATVLLANSVAAADTIVLRQSANQYALVGEGSVVTKDCTVTADPFKLDARVVRQGKKSWLVFIDRDGEEEAQCEVRYTVSMPRAKTLVAVRK